MKKLIGMLVIVCFMVTPSIGFSNDAIISTLTELYSPAVVSIQAGNRAGSGFFISSSGYILTNEHVVKDATSVIVTLSNGEGITGEVIERGKQDFAIVKIDKISTPSIRVGSSLGAKQGEAILIMGSPKGLPNTVSRGIISHPSRNIDGTQYIQVDATLNPGNSGGPILNMKGEVIGIATMTMLDAQGIGFVLPIEITFQALVDKGIPVDTSLSNSDLVLRSTKENTTLPIPRELAHVQWYYLVAGCVGILVLIGLVVYFLRYKRKQSKLGSAGKEADVSITINPVARAAPQNDDDIDIKLH